MMSFKKSICFFMASVLLGLVNTGFAQEPRDKEYTLEEITVTAEKVAANVQDVPIAMSVIGGSEARDLGVVDLYDITFLAPELNFREDSIFTGYFIRGIGTTQLTEGTSQAVAINIDGEYINRPIAMNATVFDIERVEVLRGPQGTLYGKNATGGAVNIITHKPIDEFDMFLQASYGNFNWLKTEGMVNVPLTESLSSRFAFSTSDNDGVMDTGTIGYVDNEGTKAGRLGFNFKPNDKFSWYIAGEYVKIDEDTPPQYGINLADLGIYEPGTVPSDFSPDIPDNWPLAADGWEKSDQYAIRTNMEFVLPHDVTLVYVGGYRNVDYDGYLPLNGYIPQMFSFTNRLLIDTYSHELRIHGNVPKLQWQAGVFYGDEDEESIRGLFLDIVDLGPAGHPYINYFMRYVNMNNKAAFGQFTYEIIDNLDLTAGLRYTKDETSRFGGDTVAPFAITTNNRATSLDDPRIVRLADKGYPLDGEWSALTWVIDLETTLTPVNMIYSKLSTGYKSGGFDNIGRYEKENVLAIEVGSKNRFMNERFQLNFAGYYYDYDDLQVPVFINTSVGHAIKNAGKSKIKGAELDMDWAVTQDDRLSAKVYWTDAEYIDFVSSYNTVQGPVIPANFAGHVPPHTPDWTIQLGYNHNWYTHLGVINFDVRSTYKSDYYVQAQNWAGDLQDAYTRTDASLSWLHNNGHWKVMAYVQNIEDERPITFGGYTGEGIDIYNWVKGMPRTYGLQVGYRF